MTDTPPAPRLTEATSMGVNLAVVGPVWPYRGGIAQYATRLNRALRQLTSALEVVSFRKQYPQWLYPGSSDIEPGADGQRLPDVDYVLAPFSPIGWWRATNLILQRRCTGVVFHWWTLFWAPVFALMARRLRGRGVRVAFLCHNLSDHGATGLKVRLTNWMLSQADAYIVHSSEQAASLAKLRPDAPCLQRLHPIYDRFPSASRKLPKRGRLEVLFFGFIRPYKGLNVLLDAIQELDDREVFVTIVGESWDLDESASIEAVRKRMGANLEVRLEYVADEVAATYFDRADIVVLPYLSATGSGVVALAYRYGKPVLASEVGGLKDAVVPGSTGWLVPPGSTTEISSILRSTDRDSAAMMKDGIDAFVEENSWDTLAQHVVRFIGHANGSPPPPMMPVTDSDR